MISYFYSRPYTRGDLLLFTCRRIQAISTRAPTRGATERGVWGAAHVGHFYSRPYTRGDAFALLDSPREQVFLLAPLREGRLGGGVALCRQPDISTRAPTRGATGNVDHAAAESTISTPAPTRGATKEQNPLHADVKDYFYSRPYARGDARRAFFPFSAPYFYSRPYARGDSNFSQNYKLIYMINC